jgi:hypothetical protein
MDHVKARDAGDARDLVEAQFVSEMAFDVPERLLGRIHGPRALLRSAPIMIVSRPPHLTVLAPFRGISEPGCFFRTAENNNRAVAGNVNPIVHTAGAFNPTAHLSCATIKTA